MTENDPDRPDSAEAEVAPLDAYEAVMTTRAMRRFTSEDVSEDDLWSVLDAAQQGPSGGNIQPWQFVVVRDPDTRTELAELYRSSYRRYEAAMLAVAPPPRPEDAASWERTLQASRHLADHLAEVPVLVAVVMADIEMAVSDAEGAMDVGTPFASVYPAVQNLMIAARIRGLGSALTTVYRVRHDEVRHVLGIPDGYQVVALVPLGHPRGRFGRARRRPTERVTHWDRWGDRRTRS